MTFFCVIYELIFCRVSFSLLSDERKESGQAKGDICTEYQA